MSDAWVSGCVLATGVLAGVALELAAMAHRRRDARRRRPDVEPVPWREMEHWR
jgi:hypothetical protein